MGPGPRYRAAMALANDSETLLSVGLPLAAGAFIAYRGTGSGIAATFERVIEEFTWTLALILIVELMRRSHHIHRGYNP